MVDDTPAFHKRSNPTKDTLLLSAVPSIMNVVILIAVLSVGNSSVYGASRTMAALADRRQAPKILGYIDQAGRPLVSIIVVSAFGLLCFIVAAGSETRTEAFNWMIAISGLSSIFTWASICACHIRFRQAWKYHGHTLDELAFRSQPGVIGSYLGLIFNILVLIAQFWTGFAPVGYADMTAEERTKSCFGTYLSGPIVIFLFLGFKLWKKTSFKKIQDIDVSGGRHSTPFATARGPQSWRLVAQLGQDITQELSLIRLDMPALRSSCTAFM